MDTKAIKELKPIDYVKVFFRRKRFLIIPVVLGVIGGMIVGNTMPKIYESSTLVLVEEGKVINPLIHGIAVSTSVAQRLSLLREQILGWDRVLQLISSLKLDKDVRNQYQFEMLVRKLRNNIKVNLRSQNIVTVAYRGEDPIETQQIVKTITDIFISENVRQQTKEAENAIQFINDQVEVYQKRLKEAEIAAMEEQLKKLRIDSTDKHPVVVELNRKIAAAKDDLQDGRYNVDAAVLGGTSPDTQILKDEIKKLREEFTTVSLDATDTGSNRAKVAAATNEKLYKILLLDKLDKAEAQDQGVTQRLYNDLLGRLETAKITQRLEASREGTRYTILDPARVPLKPVMPNKVLLLFVGIFIGAAAGIGIIFLVEILDHSFLGIDDASASLELPIFGAISRIVTQEDVHKEKLRRVRIAAVSAVAGIFLLIFVIFNVFMGS